MTCSTKDELIRMNLSIQNKPSFGRLNWKALILGLGAGLSSLLLPIQAAERVSFRVNNFQRSVSVPELVEFADHGEISKDLQSYFNYLKPNDQAALREALNKYVPVTSVQAADFLATPLGKVVLQQIVKVLDLPSQEAALALSSALILGSETGQLKLIQVLKDYPLPTIPVNVLAVAALIREVNNVMTLQSNLFTRLEALGNSSSGNTSARNSTENETKANTKEDTKPLAKPTLEQLSRFGSVAYQSLPFKFESRHGTTIQAIAYIPNRLPDQPRLPLVVLAPGLNSDMNALLYVGKGLASHGYAVASLNFPYTSETTVQAVIKGGLAIPPPNKWFGQPHNVSDLIDQMDRKWGNDVDTKNVGVLGQSLGGYTAIALSGARLDWDHLLEGCKSLSDPNKVVLNPAVIWQCKAPGSVEKTMDFRDPRIKATVAVNPVTNPIFSSKSMREIDVPLLAISGTADIFAPPFSQQLAPFSAMIQPDRLLAVQKNGTHLSFLEGTSKLPKTILGPDQKLARVELRGLARAFFATHLKGKNTLDLLMPKHKITDVELGRKPLRLLLRRELSSAEFDQLAPGMNDNF